MSTQCFCPTAAHRHGRNELICMIFRYLRVKLLTSEWSVHVGQPFSLIYSACACCTCSMTNWLKAICVWRPATPSMCYVQRMNIFLLTKIRVREWILTSSSRKISSVKSTQGDSIPNDIFEHFPCMTHQHSTFRTKYKSQSPTSIQYTWVWFISTCMLPPDNNERSSVLYCSIVNASKSWIKSNRKKKQIKNWRYLTFCSENVVVNKCAVFALRNGASTMQSSTKKTKHNGKRHAVFTVQCLCCAVTLLTIQSWSTKHIHQQTISVMNAASPHLL